MFHHMLLGYSHEGGCDGQGM